MRRFGLQTRHIFGDKGAIPTVFLVENAEIAQSQRLFLFLAVFGGEQTVKRSAAPRVGVGERTQATAWKTAVAVGVIDKDDEIEFLGKSVV